MSRRRNRNRSVPSMNNESMFERETHRKKQSRFAQSTTYTRFTNAQKTYEEANSDLAKREKMYNRNIAVFRQSFNQNDTSQLPFMSGLRESQMIQSKQPLTSTICYPFEAALKTTMNQTIKKRISDFAAKTGRVATAYYRWHNKSGRNNRWGAQFECTLRDYNSNKNPEQQGFNSLIQPIHYKDFEEKEYDPKQLICSRQKRLMKIRVP